MYIHMCNVYVYVYTYTYIIYIHMCMYVYIYIYTHILYCGMVCFVRRSTLLHMLRQLRLIMQKLTPGMVRLLVLD